MKKAEKGYTLEDIRKAQEEISRELTAEGLPGSAVQALEKASQSLRNMERALTKAEEKELLPVLKKENESLKELTKSMARRSEHLFRINGILQKIIQKTGKAIDILDLVR